jgi:hypothetical protein
VVVDVLPSNHSGQLADFQHLAALQRFDDLDLRGMNEAFRLFPHQALSSRSSPSDCIGETVKPSSHQIILPCAINQG